MSLGIGDRISNLRKGKSLTQYDLAKLLNISHQSVSKWEREESYPDILMLVDLSKLLNVTIDYLLIGKQEYLVNDISTKIRELDHKELKEVIIHCINSNVEFDLDAAVQQLDHKELKEVIIYCINSNIEFDLNVVIERLTPLGIKDIVEYSINKNIEFDLDAAIERLTPNDLKEIIKLKLNK